MSKSLPKEDQLEALRNYNLEPVNKQLRDRYDGFEEEDINELEQKFRRFMKIFIVEPDANPAPAEDVDEYWHKFILDTRRYHHFCDRVFGEYIHHIPKIDGEEVPPPSRTQALSRER